MRKQVAPKVLQVTFRPYGVTVEKQDKAAYIVTVCQKVETNIKIGKNIYLEFWGINWSSEMKIQEILNYFSYIYHM